MDYANTPQHEGDAPEVKEPAVAYGTGTRTEADILAASILGKPEAEEEDVFGFWNDLDDEPPAAPDGPYSGDWLDWRMKNVPGFKEAFLRWLEEGEDEDVDVDQLPTTDEVCDKLLWRIENNQWDDVRERMRRNGKL
jgi:hypothetical protein